MKAILVIDEMPNECSNCPVYHYQAGKCGVIYHHIGVDEENEKPSWCPLKPLPEKKVPLFDPNSATYDEEREIGIMHEIDGYNRCLEEITGETE